MLNIFGTINWWNRQAFQESSKKILISRVYTHIHTQCSDVTSSVHKHVRGTIKDSEKDSYPELENWSIGR